MVILLVKRKKTNNQIGFTDLVTDRVSPVS